MRFKSSPIVGGARRLRFGLSVLCAGVLAFSLVASASAQAAQQVQQVGRRGRPAVVDDELLVKFRPGSPAIAAAAAHRQVNAQVVRDIPGLGVQVVRVGRGLAPSQAAAYRRNPNVEYVEPNGIAYPSWTPNDPLFRNNQQWALHNTGVPGGTADVDIDAPRAWDVTRGSPNSTIAIVDTGITLTHEDLRAKIVESRNWYDGGDVNDPSGHGTHVAGTAAASTNNRLGVASVCPNCTLLNARVCDDFGGCPYDRIANGILWSVGCEWRDENNNCLSPVRARSINISIAGTFDSITLKSAVDQAWSRGAALACAAGNAGTNEVHYPAGYPNCIAVAATDANDAKASWSNYGNDWVDLAAPGVDILSTMNPTANPYSNPSGYGRLSGTSMASPHVAGIAGLVWSRTPSMSNQAVRNQIETSAVRIAGTGSLWARGRVNACTALGVSNC